ncbi:hypothetical protein PoB_002679900 [Plakobranchus ocellatus]|uniref:Uncharacterized protein n=1 Tax=Plakobranchus ocellatus TaxID=259542 RepID=A0AAV4A129_9GAST|nr:hypothetical protein PoB_002679900 [Plakobranchus ocellatus]
MFCSRHLVSMASHPLLLDNHRNRMVEKDRLLIGFYPSGHFLPVGGLLFTEAASERHALFPLSLAAETKGRTLRERETEAHQV